MVKTEFISCLKWVSHGKGKETLEKVKHNREELAEIIKELKMKEAEVKGRPKVEGEPESADIEDEDSEAEANKAIDDYYGMDNYDEEHAEPGDLEMEELILENPPDSSSEDSEDEKDEFTVKPNDNLILTGHIQDTLSVLQIYVFNNQYGEFFILHDILLPSFPVCTEWLDFDSNSKDVRGHFAAIGSMEPEIHIWNLNISGCLEPYAKLGNKKKKPKHTDAVVDLSWNSNIRNILASASADKTVLLWDLENGETLNKLGPFEKKVSSIEFHFAESHNLLAGSDDGRVKLYDCRSPDLFKAWNFGGEIERVKWNQFNPFAYFATTEQGMVHQVDIRNDKPIWDLKAHDKEVNGIALSSGCKDLLITASEDQDVKVWDIKDDKVEFVFNKYMNIGDIYCLSACPDVPYVFCCGGNNPKNHLFLWDIRENDSIVQRFAGRLDVNCIKNQIAKNVNGQSIEPQPSTSTSNSSTGTTSMRNEDGRIEISRKSQSRASPAKPKTNDEARDQLRKKKKRDRKNKNKPPKKE